MKTKKEIMKQLRFMAKNLIQESRLLIPKPYTEEEMLESFIEKYHDFGDWVYDVGEFYKQKKNKRNDIL